MLNVGLPEQYKGMTNGLMGPYNGDISDDLTPRGGSPIPLIHHYKQFTNNLDFHVRINFLDLIVICTLCV